MRSRKAIEEDMCYEKNVLDLVDNPTPRQQNELILEVLLDIRDLILRKMRKH